MGLWVSWVFWCIQVETGFVPYTLAKVRLPSPLSDDTCKVLRPRRALGGNNGLTKRETSFPSPRPLGKVGVISESRTSMKRFWGKVLWHLWLGRARLPGPLVIPLLALEAGLRADFLAVSEHRLIPARVQGEWAALR